MNLDHLIQMANRIGDFFAAMPDRGEALEGIADHVRKFWEPRMRRELLDALDAGRAEGLHDLVREAVVGHRAMLEPAAPAAR